MTEGTHLPNVKYVQLRSGRTVNALSGIYIWPSGNFITVYTKKDTNQGVIYPREQVVAMEFGEP